MPKSAFERTGLVPRSIIRTFDRFRRQLLPGTADLVIQEFRVSKYQVLVSVRCLVSLFFFPLLVNYLVKTTIFIPLAEYIWNTQQSEIFLNFYQESQAFLEMRDFKEKLYFEECVETQPEKNAEFLQIYSELNDLNDDIAFNKMKDLFSAIINLNKNKNINFDVMKEFIKINDKNESTKFIKKNELSNLINEISLSTFNQKRELESRNRDFKAKVLYKAKLLALKIRKFFILVTQEINQSVTLHIGEESSNLSLSLQGKSKLDQVELPLAIKIKKFFVLVTEKINQSFSGVTLHIGEESPNLSLSLQGKPEPKWSKLDEIELPDMSEWNRDVMLNSAPVKDVALGIWSQKKKIQLEDKGIQLTNKAIQLADFYNQQSIAAIANVFGDFVTLITLAFLVVLMKPQIIILKSFLTESIYSLSDTTKSFLLILLTDLLVGFHSPRGWEILIEILLRHFGLPENQDFVFLFVATLPVLLDTVFKYWIFRYLNQISPSTVATYHSMIE